MVRALRRLSDWGPRTIDHPGYSYIVLLSLWYHAGHLIGYLPAITIEDLLASDKIEFALAKLIYSGRMLSGLLASVFSIILYFSVRTIVKNHFLALALALMLAVGQGLAVQTLFMRTELWACFFAYFAFTCLLSAKNSSSKNRLVHFCAAGILVVLAMLTKIQIVIILVFLPMILLMLVFYY